MMTTPWKEISGTYLDFFRNDTDKLRREILDGPLFKLLNPIGKTVLDLGCGEGYFCRKLTASGAHKVVGVDVSKALLTEAKKQDPSGEYRVWDASSDSVFAPEEFDAVVANMVLMDMPALPEAFKKIAGFLKIKGVLVASIVNPYYGYPVGVWKRDIREFFRGYFHPVLKIRNYFSENKTSYTFPGQKTAIPHFHWRFSEYLRYAADAGFQLTFFEEPQITSTLAGKYTKVFLSKQLSTVPLYFILQFTLQSNKK